MPGTSGTINKSADNAFLYAWEGIARIGVMMIHCLLPGETGLFLQAAARFAVPLFFAVSGKYLFLEAEAGQMQRPSFQGLLKKKLCRLLRVTAFVLAVHTLYSLLWYLARGETLRGWLQMKYAPDAWLRLLLFNTGTVIYDGSIGFDHLWYLFAMLYVYLLLYVAGVSLLRRARFAAVPLLICYYLGLQFRNRIHFSFGAFSTDHWYALRNWLFPGLMFVLFGAAVAKVRTGQKGLMIALMGVALTAAEYTRFGTRECYIGSLLTVTGALTGDVEMPAWLTSVGKNAAQHVYYWHLIVYSLLIWMLSALPGDLHAFPATGWLLPVFTYAAAIGLSLMLHAWKQRKYMVY